MDGSFVMPQAECGQLRNCGWVICVQNASNPQTFRDLHKQRGVFQINDLLGWHLADVQRKMENIRVRSSDVDEAGGSKAIHKSVQLELADSIHIQFPCFIADHDNLQSI